MQRESKRKSEMQEAMKSKDLPCYVPSTFLKSSERIFHFMGYKGIFFLSVFLPLISVPLFFSIFCLYCEADREFNVHHSCLLVITLLHN